jgi:hypothetical protein
MLDLACVTDAHTGQEGALKSTPTYWKSYWNAAAVGGLAAKAEGGDLKGQARATAGRSSTYESEESES